MSMTMAGILHHLKANNIQTHRVVRISSIPKDNESVTLRRSSPAVRAPWAVMITLSDICTHGFPGVINKAGTAIIRVKMGINSITRFRKTRSGISDNKQSPIARARINNSIQKFRAKPTVIIKSKKVTNLTLGSKP